LKAHMEEHPYDITETPRTMRRDGSISY